MRFTSKAFMRSSIATVAGATLIAAGFIAPTAQASTPDEPIDTSERLAEIGERYDVGDVLSAEDAAVVRPSAMRVDSPTRASSFANCFRKTKSGGVNGSGTVDGCHGFRMGPNVVNNNWMAGYTATGNANVKKIKASEHVRAYGLIGSSGIGLVYAADPTATINGRTHKFSRSASFKALAAYMTISYDATFYTSKGSFNVSGG